jgi:hypothetical protein
MDYIKIEQSSSNIDNTRIKTAFEQAVIYFGKTSAGKKNFHSLFLKSIFYSIDLWLVFLDHLKQHQSLDFVTISRIHSRALHALDSDELKRFNTECALRNLT